MTATHDHTAGAPHSDGDSGGHRRHEATSPGHEDHHAHGHADPESRHHHGDPTRHFDERAAGWDDDDKIERSRVVAEAIRQQVTVDATTRLLEYGAGTGLTTQLLARGGPLGAVTLADPSAGMREVMAAKVADGRLPADARITSIDLASEDEPDASWEPDARFDLVVTVMALHHIPDAAGVVAAMAGLLAPGGHLAIVDLEAEDGSFHLDLEGFDGHDGFDREGLTAMLTTAGFTAPTWRHVHHVVKHDRPYPLFLAMAAVAD